MTKIPQVTEICRPATNFHSYCLSKWVVYSPKVTHKAEKTGRKQENQSVELFSYRLIYKNKSFSLPNCNIPCIETNPSKNKRKHVEGRTPEYIGRMAWINCVHFQFVAQLLLSFHLLRRYLDGPAPWTFLQLTLWSSPVGGADGGGRVTWGIRVV